MWNHLGMRRYSLLMAVLVVLALLAPLAGAKRKAASYSVDRSAVLKGVACAVIEGDGSRVVKGVPRDLGTSLVDPVLLVHGTGVNAGLNFRWNYMKVLPDSGYPTCWLDLPDSALVDIQLSAEYVAITLEAMAKSAKGPVDVLGHSQGGLVPRWAIKYFSPGRFKVDDYIGLASPNHGTLVAESLVFGCFESCWQMKTTSNFIAALNDGDETPGDAHYTNIYSATDELVQPVGTQELLGGYNFMLQDICPARPVDHVSIVADFVTWELVRSALENDAGPDIDELSPDACNRDRMPGAGSPDFSDFPPEWGDGHFTSEEPPVKPYAS